MKSIKSSVRYALQLFGKLLAKLSDANSALEVIAEAYIMELAAKKIKVKHNNLELALSGVNAINKMRAKTFSIKEPETLEWIDSFDQGSEFWDVGANVGLYSCYAAKRKLCNVYAIEPSVFNLEFLARNIFANELQERVTIVPIAMSDFTGANTLNMTTTEWGGALSSFGEDFGWDGNKLDTVFQFRTLGLPLDTALDLGLIAKPDYIKIDVDGIEHLILRGGTKALSSARSVLIEINDKFISQAEECRAILENAGLILDRKEHGEMFSAADSFGGGHIWNQIWVRNDS